MAIFQKMWMYLLDNLAWILRFMALEGDLDELRMV
jgi:hypothetical protein